MIYRFTCKNCGEIELNIKVAELPNAKCPHCQSTNIERKWDSIMSVWKCEGNFGKSN